MWSVVLKMEDLSVIDGWTDGKTNNYIYLFAPLLVLSLSMIKKSLGNYMRLGKNYGDLKTK